jgi:hypothetical protein
MDRIPNVGDRVMSDFPLEPVHRVGEVVRIWHPYKQVRVRWENGNETNIWVRDLKDLS